ncbi:MAG: hypothetical protein ACOVQX_07340, partial [Legionella sp.]
MARLMLSDELWSKLKKIMLQHQIDDKSNLRMMVGCPWRDLPIAFGCSSRGVALKFNQSVVGWALACRI